jgi:hypothetical protein
MTRELILRFVWQLPDGLDSNALEKRLNEYLKKDEVIQVPLPHNLGLPANGATLESYTLRDSPEEGESVSVIRVTSMILGGMPKHHLFDR